MAVEELIHSLTKLKTSISRKDLKRIEVNAYLSSVFDFFPLIYMLKRTKKRKTLYFYVHQNSHLILRLSLQGAPPLAPAPHPHWCTHRMHRWKRLDHCWDTPEPPGKEIERHSMHAQSRKYISSIYMGWFKYKLVRLSWLSISLDVVTHHKCYFVLLCSLKKQLWKNTFCLSLYSKLIAEIRARNWCKKMLIIINVYHCFYLQIQMFTLSPCRIGSPFWPTLHNKL